MPGDKDSAVVIMEKKNDYVIKMQENARQRNIRRSLCKNRRQHPTRLKTFSGFQV